MSSKRPGRKLLACAALSAGVLLGSGAAMADPAPRVAEKPTTSLGSWLAALRLLVTEPACSNAVELQPECRMGNMKGPGYTDESASAALAKATPAPRPQAARPRR